MVFESLICGLTCFNRLDVACALVIAYLSFRAVFGKGGQRNPPLPPGPKPFPLLGNLFDVPEGTEGPNYTKYAEKYGVCEKTLILRDCSTNYILQVPSIHS